METNAVQEESKLMGSIIITVHAKSYVNILLYIQKSMMAEWLEQASQWHEM